MNYQQIIAWKNGRLEQPCYEPAPVGFFRVTRQWIFENSSSEVCPAWTKLQKEALGCGLHSGWIERSCGTLIEDWRRSLFERDSAVYAANERNQSH